jgi:long-chain acyl-CoA synthetase
MPMRLTHALTRARRVAGDHAAVILGDRQWTYAEFAGRVERLAGLFIELGLRPGGRVAMLAHSSHRYLEFYFATLWAGGIIVPVSTRYALAETIFLLDDSGAALLLVDDAFAPLVPDLRKALPGLKHVIHAGENHIGAGIIDYEAATAAMKAAPDRGGCGDDVAVLFYTGGTTGRAKGVMLTHANCMTNSYNAIFHQKLTAGLVGLHAGPLYHTAAGSRVFTNTLLAATHVVIPRFTAAGALAAIERHKVTMVALVPTMMTMILNEPTFATCDLSSLDRISYGGAPTPVASLEALIRRLPHV